MDAEAEPWAATRWRLALALLVLFAALLRLSSIGESLWLDEVVSVTQAGKDLAGMLAATASDNYPPLHNLVLMPIVHLVGTNEVVVRLPSLALGLLTIVVAAQLARALYGARAGLVAAVMVALSPLHIYYAQEARMYTLLASCAALATLTLVRWVNAPTTRNAALHTLATVLLCYSHVYAAFIVVAHNVWVFGVWWRRPLEARPPMRAWILSQAITLAAFTPWLVILIDRVADFRARGFWIERPGLGELAELALAYASLAAPVLFVALIAAFRRDVPGPERTPTMPLSVAERGLLLVACIASTVLIPFLASLVVQPFFHLRYTIAASTAVFVLAAGGLVALAHTPRRLTIVMTVVVLLFAPLVVRYHLRAHRSDARGMATLLDERLASGESLVLWPGYDSVVYHHYLRAQVPMREIPKQVHRGFRERGWLPIARTPGPLWFVTSRTDPTVTDWIVGSLSADRDVGPMLETEQVRAWRFGPRRSAPREHDGPVQLPDGGTQALP